MEFVIGGFFLCILGLAALGLPGTRRDRSAAAPPPAAPQAAPHLATRTNSPLTQPIAGAPPANQRYVIQNGKLVAVSS